MSHRKPTGDRTRLSLWTVVGLFSCALALRLVLSLGVLRAPERSDTFDGIEYWAFAQSIIAGHGFVRDQVLDNGTRIAVPEIFRTPGYPVFLAAARILSLPWPVSVILLQLLIGSATAPLVYIVTLRIGGRAAPAVFAGMLFALDLPSAMHASLVLSETLAAFLLAVALLFGVRYVGARRVQDLVPALVSFVLAAHVRPVFLGIASPVALALAIRSLGNRRTFLQMLLIFGPIVGVGIGGWVIRNARTGGYAVFSAVGDYAWLFHAAGLEALEGGGDVDAIMEEYRTELASGLPPNTKQLDQGRWYQAMRKKGLKEIQSRWTLVPKYASRNVFQLMTNVDHQTFRQITGHPAAPAVHSGGLTGKIARSATGAPGLWAVVGAQLVLTAVLWLGILCAVARVVAGRFCRPIRNVVVCLLIAATLGLASSALPNAQVRFRLSLLPILLPVAALGYFGGREGRMAVSAPKTP